MASSDGPPGGDATTADAGHFHEHCVSLELFAGQRIVRAARSVTDRPLIDDDRLAPRKQWAEHALVQSGSKTAASGALSVLEQWLGEARRVGMGNAAAKHCWMFRDDSDDMAVSCRNGRRSEGYASGVHLTTIVSRSLKFTGRPIKPTAIVRSLLSPAHHLYLTKDNPKQ